MVPVTECRAWHIPRMPLQATEAGHKTANARDLEKSGILAKNEREDARIIGVLSGGYSTVPGEVPPTPRYEPSLE